MATVSPQQVQQRRDVLLARDTGLRVIVLEADPKTGEVECFAIKAHGHWAEHTYASAGVAYHLDLEPTQEA